MTLTRAHDLIRLVLAFVLLAFGVPGLAEPPIKQYTLVVTPLSAPNVKTVFTATLTNTATQGGQNSSFTSMELVPQPGITISTTDPVTVTNDGVAVPSSNVTVTATRIGVSNLSPVARGRPVVVTFSATITLTTCQSSLYWNLDPTTTPAGTAFHAWTGSSFSGDEFKLTGTLPTTSLACGLVFNKPPVSTTFSSPTTPIKAALGADVQVCLWNGSACDTSYVGNVTIAKVPFAGSGTGALGGNGPTATSGGIATFGGLTLDATGMYKLQASDGTRLSDIATILVGEGVLACESGGTGANEFEDGDGDSATKGVRGGNKDGSPCILVQYEFIDEIATENRTIFRWDITLQPGATFQYGVKFLPEFVGANGLPQGVTRFQWLDSAGNPFPPDTAGPFSGAVPGKACLMKDLPFEYGTLNAALAPGTGTNLPIQINVTNASSVPPVPFPIVIRSERMTVTGVPSGTIVNGVQTWNVTRGAAAGETAPPTDNHPVGQKAMSTPFPLFTHGGVLQVMQMCIAKETWEPVKAGGVDCDVPPAAPNSCTQVLQVVNDGGDGSMIRF